MTASGPWDDQTAHFDIADVQCAAAGTGPGPEAFPPGEVLKDSFRVESRLGEGGMGIVYRGTQLSLGRAVAIKTISPSSQITDELVQRIFREARILSQLNHPNIVSIIDFGSAGSRATPFMVMELLTGKPLDAYVTPRNRPPLRQVLGLMIQMCAVVAAAHHANIIHRDLKPSNVFIIAVAGSPDPVVKLLDFGLARPAALMPDSGLALTKEGVGVGTCGFTAPEQLSGSGDPDARADVYGLGALLYFLLTGRAPYQSQTVNAVLVKQITQPPDPIDFPALGLAGAEAIESILVKAMSRLREDRYQTVGEFKGALEAILTSILSNPACVGMQQTFTGPAMPTHVGSPRKPTTANVPTAVHTAIAQPHSWQRRLLPLLLLAGLLFGGGGE